MNKRTINPEEKIQKVIRTSRRLFVEKGYCGVSIPAIVRESGVSTGAIYSYFSDKETLAKDIHTQTIEEFNQLFQQRLTGEETVYEVLRIFAELVCDLTETEPTMMAYMLFMKHGGVICNLSPICSTEPFRILQTHLKRGIEQGEIRVDDFMIAGLSFTGVILRAAELRMDGVLTQPLTDICETLIENGWNAIKS